MTFRQLAAPAGNKGSAEGVPPDDPPLASTSRRGIPLYEKVLIASTVLPD